MPFSNGFLTQIINFAVQHLRRQAFEPKYKPAQVVNGKIQKEKK